MYLNNNNRSAHKLPSTLILGSNRPTTTNNNTTNEQQENANQPNTMAQTFRVMKPKMPPLPKLAASLSSSYVPNTQDSTTGRAPQIAGGYNQSGNVPRQNYGGAPHYSGGGAPGRNINSSLPTDHYLKKVMNQFESGEKLALVDDNLLGQSTYDTNYVAILKLVKVKIISNISKNTGKPYNMVVYDVMDHKGYITKMTYFASDQADAIAKANAVIVGSCFALSGWKVEPATSYDSYYHVCQVLKYDKFTTRMEPLRLDCEQAVKIATKFANVTPACHPSVGPHNPNPKVRSVKLNELQLYADSTVVQLDYVRMIEPDTDPDSKEFMLLDNTNTMVKLRLYSDVSLHLEYNGLYCFYNVRIGHEFQEVTKAMDMEVDDPTEEGKKMIVRNSKRLYVSKDPITVINYDKNSIAIIMDEDLLRKDEEELHHSSVVGGLPDCEPTDIKWNKLPPPSALIIKQAHLEAMQQGMNAASNADASSSFYSSANTRVQSGFGNASNDASNQQGQQQLQRGVQMVGAKRPSNAVMPTYSIPNRSLNNNGTINRATTSTTSFANNYTHQSGTTGSRPTLTFDEAQQEFEKLPPGRNRMLNYVLKGGRVLRFAMDANGNELVWVYCECTYDRNCKKSVDLDTNECGAHHPQSGPSSYAYKIPAFVSDADNRIEKVVLFNSSALAVTGNRTASQLVKEDPPANPVDFQTFICPNFPQFHTGNVEIVLRLKEGFGGNQPDHTVISMIPKGTTARNVIPSSPAPGIAKQARGAY